MLTGGDWGGTFDWTLDRRRRPHFRSATSTCGSRAPTTRRRPTQSSSATEPAGGWCTRPTPARVDRGAFGNGADLVLSEATYQERQQGVAAPPHGGGSRRGRARSRGAAADADPPLAGARPGGVGGGGIGRVRRAGDAGGTSPGHEGVGTGMGTRPHGNTARTGASPTSCGRSRSPATSRSSRRARCWWSSARPGCCAPRRPRSGCRRGCAARDAAGSPPSTRCCPGSTSERSDREAARGRQSGRTQEIQRLIGRSLRAVTDLTAMGEVQVTVDCDVLQADGGTRTAVDLRRVRRARTTRSRGSSRPRAWARTRSPTSCAAISVGVVDALAHLDLDYSEDVRAEVDMNVVMTGAGRFIEVQGTAEGMPFSRTRARRPARAGRGRDRPDLRAPARDARRAARHRDAAREVRPRHGEPRQGTRDRGHPAETRHPISSWSRDRATLPTSTKPARRSRTTPG